MEEEGEERADLGRPGIPQPLRVTVPMGKLRRRRRSGSPAAPPRPGLDRPPRSIVVVVGWGKFSPLCLCNSRPPEAGPPGEGTRTPGPRDTHTHPRPANAQPRCPRANKSRVCRERGGRRGPGAMRIRWSRALRRGQRSPGGRGDRSGAAVADTPAGASTPRASAPGRRRPPARSSGRPARQGRSPNVVAAQVRPSECPRAQCPKVEPPRAARAAPPGSPAGLKSLAPSPQNLNKVL